MTDRSAFHGPIPVSSATEQIKVDTIAPALYDDHVSHAKLAAEINLDGDGRYLFVAATSVGSDWPSIVVALRYEPNAGGFDPGVAVTDSCIFIGAGKIALCYERSPRPRELWTEHVELGFLGWAVHGDIVVMSAELTLAAWDQNGRKLWSTFVEPPWNYQVEDNRVTLDVMGSISTFDLMTGPTPPSHGGRQ